MRNCAELLNILEDWQNRGIYHFIKSKANSKDFFIGIRDNYLNIYYKCASVILISIKKNKLEFKTHYKYLGLQDSETLKKKPYIIISFEELSRKFEKMLVHIFSIQLCQNVDSGKHKRREKICQQWIVNEANARRESDWYYVDLEYTMQGVPTGRFDMIAVSKKKVDGKHRVALIELKVNDSSYAGMDGSRKKQHEKEFNLILAKKDELYNSGFEPLKFGSGIVGHIADYLRFLHKKIYYDTLKQEIIDIIKCHKRLGILKDPGLSLISSVNDLADKPEVHIVSYTKVPDDKEPSNVAVPIKTLKESMYKYLFNEPRNTVKRTSGYCLENCINGANINGFNILKDELFTDKNEIHCVQDIKGEIFDFYFTFIDATRSDAWNCLPKI